MSKLVIRLKKGTGFGDSYKFTSWYDLTFSSSQTNLHSKVIFNPKEGTITPDGAVNQLAFLYQPTNGQPRIYGKDVEINGIKYGEFIYLLCPEEVVEGGLKFELYYVTDKITYTTQLYTDGNKTKFETEAGTEYVYTVTVNKTEAKVTDTSINDWTSAVLPDNGEVETVQ